MGMEAPQPQSLRGTTCSTSCSRAPTLLQTRATHWCTSFVSYCCRSGRQYGTSGNTQLSLPKIQSDSQSTAGAVGRVCMLAWMLHSRRIRLCSILYSAACDAASEIVTLPMGVQSWARSFVYDVNQCGSMHALCCSQPSLKLFSGGSHVCLNALGIGAADPDNPCLYGSGQLVLTVGNQEAHQLSL